MQRFSSVLAGSCCCPVVRHSFFLFTALLPLTRTYVGAALHRPLRHGARCRPGGFTTTFVTAAVADLRVPACSRDNPPSHIAPRPCTAIASSRAPAFDAPLDGGRTCRWGRVASAFLGNALRWWCAAREWACKHGEGPPRVHTDSQWLRHGRALLRARPHQPRHHCNRRTRPLLSLGALGAGMEVSCEHAEFQGALTGPDRD